MLFFKRTQLWGIPNTIHQDSGMITEQTTSHKSYLTIGKSRPMHNINQRFPVSGPPLHLVSTFLTSEIILPTIQYASMRPSLNTIWYLNFHKWYTDAAKMTLLPQHMNEAFEQCFTNQVISVSRLSAILYKRHFLCTVSHTVWEWTKKEQMLQILICRRTKHILVPLQYPRNEPIVCI